MIRVLVSGSGKMGRAILDAIDAEDGLDPVGVVDAMATASAITLPSGKHLPVATDAGAACDAARPDVVIDFTNAAWTPVLTEAALRRGVRPVIGTTGLPQDYVDALARACRERKLGGLLAANFAIGAVLLMHMAKVASRFFDAAEIIELHHDKKVDAPSGTSIATARGMLEARGGRPFDRNVPDAETIAGTRAGALDGITIHSVRLPGLVAHQEVLFGGIGQTLSIRHDSIGRDSFLPGIILATREVMQRQELVIGLDALFGMT
ncbi:MAG: 4-hydroxy-tetrahydrodipicolinate reductase [Chloroflexi bacterium]|nr:4-hydroxy-tetrahydrodipicolinate reductase [Chloroflexota bacterium]